MQASILRVSTLASLIGIHLKRPTSSSLFTRSQSALFQSHIHSQSLEQKYLHTCANCVSKASTDDSNPTTPHIDSTIARALLLSYYACSSRSRSLLASRCLIETLIEAYRQGLTVEDIQLALSLATITAHSAGIDQVVHEGGGGAGSAGRHPLSLDPLELDLLQAWAAIVMLTLQEVELELYPEGKARRIESGNHGGVLSDQGTTRAGLQAYVDSALGQRRKDGITLKRMLLQQNLQKSNIVSNSPEEVQGVSPALLMLQQNARLVLLTVEMIASGELKESCGNLPPLSATKREPEGGGDEASSQDEEEESNVEEVLSDPHWPALDYMQSFLVMNSMTDVDDVSPRSMAARVLLSFMGAVQGLLYPAMDFVDSTIRAYLSGLTVDDVLTALQREDFSETGGVVPVGVERLPGPAGVSAALFTQWLSMVYIALAQLGAAHPKSGQSTGWAWASEPIMSSLSSGDDEDEYAASAAMEAYGVAQFVSSTLESRVEKESFLARDVSKPQSEGFLMKVEDPDLLPSSPAVLIVAQQVSLISMVADRVRKGLVPIQEPLLRRE